MSVVIYLSDPSKGLVKTVRPPQITMATTAEPAFCDTGLGIYVIEAGTGVGKTYAYLTPALMSGKRVVISTAKKTLQTQLYDRDIPHVQSIVSPEATYALLKGKANYVCQLRFQEFLNGGESSRYSDRVIQDVKRWLDTHPTGDLEAYPDAGDVYFGSHIRITECVRSVCSRVHKCGYIQNKLEAADAQILVVNHALLAYDLLIGGGKILGHTDVLVIDEAHQAPKFFREAYTQSMFPKQPEILEKLLATDMRVKMPSRIKELYSHVFQHVNDASGKLVVTPTLRSSFISLQKEWMGLREQFVKNNLLPEDKEGVEIDLTELPNETEAQNDAYARTKSKMTAAASFVLNQLNLCSIVLGQVPQELTLKAKDVEYLSMVERREMENYDHIEIKTTPLDVGPLVAPGLLHIGRVILTSATMTPVKNSWGYICREFGLAESQLKAKISLDSPFDYKNNSALYLSTTAPEWETTGRNNPEAYFEKMTKEIHDLVMASQGGAFVICPSKADMNKYYDLLRRETGMYTVFKQTANVDQDLHNFQTSRNAVLIGVQSIGEGVDLPGTDVLRLVIVPRLPFTPPSDVIMQTHMDRLKERILEDGGSAMEANMKAFNTYSLPEMIFKLKQWAGRLIRSAEDRGVVAVLDTRIIKKRYGRMVQESLPFPVTMEREKVMRFLKVLSTWKPRPVQLS
jgi:ATP-dependent DNA helicase DinG